ncbi:periplasmic binding protein-like I [Gaertneriomyces semiglobifer]|nr:periplasmic binding protein-like I [Gaertneriomyces semiglobifer]
MALPPPPIRLALMYPFTLWPEMEERAYNGALMAAEEITANSAAWFDEHPLEIVKVDTGGLNAGKVLAAAHDVTTGEVSSSPGAFQGVLGERYSDSSKMIAYTLSSHKIFQCSVWSTSPSLGKKEEFPKFFRLVADDNFQGLVMLRLVHTLGWRRIGILAGSGTYGQDLLLKVLSSAAAYGIEVVASYTYDLDDIAGTDYRMQQLKSLGARAMLTLAGGEAEAINLFRALNRNGMIGPEYAYIGGDTMLRLLQASNVQPSDFPLVQGVMVTDPLEYTSYSDDFIAAYKLRFGGAEPPSGAIAHYDAVYAFAHAFKKIMTDNSWTADKIADGSWQSLDLNVAQFTDITFDGAMGPAAFLPNGDSAAANFRILNVQGNEVVEVAAGTADVLNIHSTVKYFGDATLPPSDHPFIHDEIVGYKKAGPLIIISISSLFILAVAVSIPTLLIFRTHPLLKPLSPIFMAYSGSGMLLILLTILVNAKEVPNKTSCNSYMALLAVGFAVVVGGILVKLRRLYKIFDNKISQRRALPVRILFMNSLAVVAVELIIVLVWAGAFPIEAIEHTILSEQIHYYECSTVNATASDALLITILAYNAILVLLCCWYAYQTRNIYSAFNEAKAIGIAIYNVFFCAVIIIVVTYLAKLGVVTSFIVRSIFILVGVAVTYYTLIGRYIVALIMKSDGDSENSTANGSSESPSHGAKKNRNRSVALGPFKGATFPVRGRSKVTSTQWRNFNVYIAAKPVAILAIVNEAEPSVGLAISIGQLECRTKNDVFIVTWAKGSVEFQTASVEEAADWVESIAAIAAGEVSSGKRPSNRGGDPAGTPKGSKGTANMLAIAASGEDEPEQQQSG